jgi:signal transduction histidine kinase
MGGVFDSLLAGTSNSAGFLPHALCLSVDANLLWLHILSDAVIALSYYSIPLALAWFAWRRRDLTHRWLFLLFGAFILACGTTHLFHIWVLFEPDYWLEGYVKVATATVSLVTAVLLWPIVPKLLALPSPQQLSTEVAERRAAEAEVRALNLTLEDRVRCRTAELEEANRALVTARDDAERAKQQAERANLAKSKFLAAASHDLRQPVQALMYFSSVLGMKTKDTAVGDLAAEMDRSVGAIAMLLEALLDVSKLDAGVVRPEIGDVCVGDLLKRMNSEFAPLAAEKGVRLSAVGSSATVRSDPVLLGRIVQNLVANALRYTESGRILIGCRRHGGELRIDVHDTGLGIPPDRLEDIFDEFTQLGNPERDRAKGLGLGLAIVRRLSRLLRHPVTVRSTPGKGSTFSISVPLAAQSAAVLAAE